MAVLLEGLQGSGKSYYATHMMNQDADKYHKIFTNIDGIKTTCKIVNLEFKGFVANILEECYRVQVDNDGTFQEAIDFLIKMHVLPPNPSKDNRILLVVDEAQNYFGKSAKISPALVWFITQHRHLYIELYLITQKYTLLRPDYHLFNLVYQAYPPVKQFNKKKIRYREYAGLPLNADNLSKTFSLTKKKEIFDMYVSGDKVESPSILKKFIVYIVLLIVASVSLLFYFLSTFGATPDPLESVKPSPLSPNSKSISVAKDRTVNVKKSRLFLFRISGDGYFKIDQIEGDIAYPIRLLTYLKNNFFETVVAKKKMGYGITYLYVVCSKDLKEFLAIDTQETSGIQLNAMGIDQDLSE